MGNISVFDTKIYKHLFAYQPMSDIWSEEQLLQTWLHFEIALAQAQAQLELIPTEAAIAIEKYCQLSYVNIDNISLETKKVGMAIKPLLNEVIRASGNNKLVKDYLHWGCTTQDLLDSANAIRIKKSIVLLKEQLLTLINVCKEMAQEHKATVMVSRTNSQDALPTSWGLHVSGYMMELARNFERLDALQARATEGMYGGAVGNLSSIGEIGITLRNEIMSKLDISKPTGFYNSSQDNIVEVICISGIIHGTLQRIANDVELMGRAAIFEAKESAGKASSSAMPHKGNPRISNMIQTLARMGQMYANGSFNMMDQTDTRSASMRMLNWSLLPEAMVCLATSLHNAIQLMSNLYVNKDKMRENFSHSNNFVMSEAIMMALAKKIGRKDAYEYVQKSIANVADKDLKYVLLANNIGQYFSEDELDYLLNPSNYLGANDILIEEAIEYVDKLSI